MKTKILSLCLSFLFALAIMFAFNQAFNTSMGSAKACVDCKNCQTCQDNVSKGYADCYKGCEKKYAGRRLDDPEVRKGLEQCSDSCHKQYNYTKCDKVCAGCAGTAIPE